MLNREYRNAANQAVASTPRLAGSGLRRYSPSATRINDISISLQKAGKRAKTLSKQVNRHFGLKYR
jgi:hypothetical protein